MSRQNDVIQKEAQRHHELEILKYQFGDELDIALKVIASEEEFRRWLSAIIDGMPDDELNIVQSQLGPDGLKVFHELTEKRFSKVAYLNYQAHKQPVNRENQAECLAWYLAYAWWQGRLGINPCDDNPKEAAERANADWQAWMGEAESALELWPALREQQASIF